MTRTHSQMHRKDKYSAQSFGQFGRMVECPFTKSSRSHLGIGDFCFCEFCKTFLVSCTNVVTEVILNLVLRKVFPWYLVLHQSWLSMHYTE